MKRKVITGLILTLFVTILFSMVFNVAPAADKQNPKYGIPFPGMMLVYTQQFLELVRTVTFHPSLDPEHIWVRDSFRPDDPFEIDVKTRKIVDWPVECYSQFLIPKVRIGEDVCIAVPGSEPTGGTITVVGFQKIAVMGKIVYALVLKYSTPTDILTMFYHKNTGILLGGQHVWFNGEGKLQNSWAMILTDANVPFGY